MKLTYSQFVELYKTIFQMHQVSEIESIEIDFYDEIGQITPPYYKFTIKQQNQFNTEIDIEGLENE
jgi:hypothetical protein